MKIEIIKSLLAFALSATIGFILEIIAPETEWRNLISFGVGTISILMVFIPAIGIIYKDARRGVSVKLYAWIMTIVLILANLIFACYEYPIDVYIAIILLLTIVGVMGIYILSKTKPAK